MKSKTLSIILLSYYSESRLETSCKKIAEAMKAAGIPFELIIMDDGSKDASYEIALELEAKHPHITAYQLSRNYTTPYAQFAGLSVCKGDCAVFVPDDLQRPLDVVVEMYRKWEAGNKVVVAYRISRNDGWLNDLFSGFYYALMNKFSVVSFPPGGADGFLADREVIDIINTRIHPKNTSIVVEVLRLGFSPCFFPFERPPAKQKSRWTFKKKVRLAMDTFFASSSFPIKAITFMGFFTFFTCLILIGVLIAAKLWSDNTLFGFPIPGWTTTLIFITMFNGLILLCMGIVAEYVWRIYEEVKDRPGFIIKKKEKDHPK